MVDLSSMKIASYWCEQQNTPLHLSLYCFRPPPTLNLEPSVIKHHSQLTLSITLFFATAFWGIFWLPLRHIENAGISGIWAVIAINAVPLLFLIPIIIVRRQHLFTHLKTKCLAGFAIGGGMAFYAIAFLYSTVLRTTLLFYMTPIWATLLAILILKEKTTWGRWLAIAVGLTGLLLILSGKESAPLSQGLNRGDFFALLAGLFWGYGTVLIKKTPNIPAIDIIPAQYFWAVVISAVVLITTIGTVDFRIPDARQLLSALPLIVGFYVIIILPTMLISTRICQLLSPGRVCLLMMSEVLVAGISAPLIAGEAVTATEWFAGSLIILATIIEVYSPQLKDNIKAPS